VLTLASAKSSTTDHGKVREKVPAKASGMRGNGGVNKVLHDIYSMMNDEYVQFDIRLPGICQQKIEKCTGRTHLKKKVCGMSVPSHQGYALRWP
jgi:hypothetical protein